MKDDRGSMEDILSGAWVAIAAALLMVVILGLLQSTGQADRTISLQSLASQICGDIGTAAACAVAYSFNGTYAFEGVAVRVTSDYVVASDPSGNEFARPLPVRVCPDACACNGVVLWNDTKEMREYLNTTCGSPGTATSPLNLTGGSKAKELFNKACLAMDSSPLYLDTQKPLTIEKLLVYTYNDTAHTMESEPYVFVFQR